MLYDNVYALSGLLSHFLQGTLLWNRTSADPRSAA